MRAVVLAGGKGTRLAPYTTVLPKPLMPVGDVPILELCLRQLRYHGFSDVTLAVGHLAELLMAYFGDGSKYGIRISYSKEETPLGTVGPLALIPEIRQGTFLVMNGDILTDLAYGKLIERHRQSGAAITIAVCRRDVNVDLGVIEVDDNCDLIGYLEKPTLHYLVSMGIYIFEPRALASVQPGQHLDLPALVLSLLRRGDKVSGYQHDGYWLDIGRSDDYQKAVSDFDQLRKSLLPPVPVG